MRFRFNIAPDLIAGAEMVVIGPYKYIRHPMYTSVLGITLSVVIFSFSYFLLMIWVILFVTILMKLSYEETILLKKFPDYSDYKLKTKKLIPFLF
jgi:protein-S-isoprenylcysteine O-methyltransferase Ste14